MSANERQVAGSHYGLGKYQHWDMVVEYDLNYFEGQVTKYVMRARNKNGKQDLEKALHFLEKYLEVYDQMIGEIIALTAPVHDFSPSYDLEMRARAGLSEEGFRTDAGGQTLFKCVHCRAEAWGKYAYTTTLDHAPTCPLATPQTTFHAPV